MVLDFVQSFLQFGLGFPTSCNLTLILQEVALMLLNLSIVPSSKRRKVLTSAQTPRRRFRLPSLLQPPFPCVCSSLNDRKQPYGYGGRRVSAATFSTRPAAANRLYTTPPARIDAWAPVTMRYDTRPSQTSFHSIGPHVQSVQNHIFPPRGAAEQPCDHLNYQGSCIYISGDTSQQALHASPVSLVQRQQGL